jgi:polysaccharide biosynthesis/export protein
MLDNKRGLLRLFVLVFLFAAVIFPAAAQTPVSHPKLETSDETNARIRELAGSALIGSKPSRIGPGDLIGVEVFDVPELTREARVSDSGFISIPLVGVPIQVNGLTTAEAEEKISEILQVKGLVTHPEVMVSVREEKSQPITVVGEVRNPQVIQAVRSMRLLEVLSAAGGISENAGNVVLITRPASSQPAIKTGFDGPNSTETPDVRNVSMPMDPTMTTITVKLGDLLSDPDPVRNIPLYGGDIVTVPRGGIFYIVGAVNHPGGFILQSDADKMTTLKALAMAQGGVPSAKLKNAVIMRPNKATGKDDIIPVNLRKIMDRKAEDARLLPNDVLFIPDSASMRALRLIGAAAVNATTGVAIYRAGTY